MNPVFIILVILLAICLWFLLSSVFTPLGKFISQIVNDVLSEMFPEKTDGEE